MSNRRRWSNDEEKVILDQIRLNPNNLSKAFSNAATQLNRTPQAVKARWYLTLRDRSETCFMTISSKAVSKNRKNNKIPNSSNTRKMRSTLWKRIISLLKIK